MKLKLLTLALITSLSTAALAEGQKLTTDESDACAAVLCLSSGKRPDECNPPLARYFGIHFKNPQDTINARKDFLALCPTSNDDTQMKSLESAIANGAGRCDAAALNSSQTKVVYVQRCDSNGSFLGEGGCWEEPVTVIDPSLPDYCSTYSQHGYTYRVGTATYVGDPLNGGHWTTIQQ